MRGVPLTFTILLYAVPLLSHFEKSLYADGTFYQLLSFTGAFF